MIPEQLAILTDGVQEAGLALAQNGSDTSEFSKISTFDYGIPADRSVEDILLEAVACTELDCEIIAEESGTSGTSGAEYQVYLDPLDGSVNYSRGIPSFCIGVGVYRENRPEVGIVFDPSRQELFVAQVGKGVALNNLPYRVPRHTGNLLVHLEWFGAENFPQVVGKLWAKGVRASTAGSGVLALLYGCIGRGDGAILLQNKPWDIAPGLVFAKELGCIATSLDGSEVDLTHPKLDVVAGKDQITHLLLQEALS